MNNLTEAAVTIVLAIVGVATLALIISKKSNTTNVIQSAASGVGNLLAVAESPVTGTETAVSLAYPQESNY